jgi:hypothetical protein
MSDPMQDYILLDTGPSERGAHRIMTAGKCLRQYAYDVQAHADPAKKEPKNPAFMVGTMLHLMLAHRYAIKAFRDGADTLDAADRVLTRDDAGRILSPLLALSEFVERDTSGQADQFVDGVMAAYAAYDVKYGAESKWEVIGVERQYRVNLPGVPAEISLYTQRADLVVRDRSTGLVYFVDHKKAYEISAKTAAQYTLHGQFLGYAKLGRHFYGDKFGGVTLNRIRVAPPQFSRTPIDPAPRAVASYVANVVAIEKMIQHCITTHGPAELTAEAWPAAFSEEVCYGKYGKCKYFERCRFGTAP